MDGEGNELDIVRGIGDVINSSEDLLGGVGVDVGDHVVVIQVGLETPCELDLAVGSDIVDQLALSILL